MYKYTLRELLLFLLWLVMLAPSCAYRTSGPQTGKEWENSLGMVFKPVGKLHVKFSQYDTRVKDFEVFVKETGYDATSGMFSLKGGEWGHNGDSWKSPGFSQTGDHPVCGVSWNDAKAFCEWLTKKELASGELGEHQRYRLPTEAEWNVAVENASLKDAVTGLDEDGVRTKVVGSKGGNQYGLYDMRGNVWQWCENLYDINQKYRVLRGGSWYGYSLPEISCRNPFDPRCRYNCFGFRCVVVFTP